jgi:hypothetical protein
MNRGAEKPYLRAFARSLGDALPAAPTSILQREAGAPKNASRAPSLARSSLKLGKGSVVKLQVARTFCALLSARQEYPDGPPRRRPIRSGGCVCRLK